MKILALEEPKKVRADIVLEVRAERCNFCGEEKDKCVRGELDSSFTYLKQPETELAKVIIGEPSLANYSLRYQYRIENYGLRSVVKDTLSEFRSATEQQSVEICFDCIKQLAKLIK